MSSTTKKALLLGAGFVCEPVIQALSQADVHVTVACRTLHSAQALASNYKNTTAIALDVSQDAAGLNNAITKTDIIISLIPYVYHATVVEAAIAHRKPVVTTSYISPALWALDEKAKSAGVTVLNEIGLDPGIDHLYAVKTIDEVHRAGGQIRSFTSWCGALPAPENADNPLGYKFSWSPRGGLLALLNSAQWYKDGELATVEGKDLMAVAESQKITEGFDNLVGYPNRDAVGFRDFYRIPEAGTVFRGTLRYAGFPEIIRALVAIGYFSQDEVPALNDAVTERITSFLSTEETSRVVSGLRWIGLFDASVPVNGRDTPLDTLCAVLEQRMAYEPGERDMIILQHAFDIECADGSKEKRTSTLVEYGEPTAPGSRSAMAKLVGLPCAVGVLAVLEGRISQKGMVAPWTAVEIARLLREELSERFGIELEEKVVG
ncbi:hypothetical protein AnigIFM59636_009260 [Aspergillus niger]|nr:hypothetical protein AnigIFM59636_009260 [Aspergillus niger]